MGRASVPPSRLPVRGCPTSRPGSPGFGPIEQAFAGLEALLRKAAGRTVEGPWGAIARVPDPFTPAGCANCLAAAGYDAD
jgi:hypothetical protein